MPFKSTYVNYAQGMQWWQDPSGVYCTNYTSDSVTCKVTLGKAVLRCDACTNPQCVSAGTCIWIQNEAGYSTTIYSLPSGKQGILNMLISTARIGGTGYSIPAFPSIYDGINLWDTYVFYRGFHSFNYFRAGQTAFYNPETNAFVSYVYDSYGTIVKVEASKIGLFFTSLNITYQFNTNGYYISGHLLFISYEASPELIMPIDYDEYILTQELRDVVGWSINGYAQVGWNADDILRVVQSLYPDRPWVVYDDRTLTAYANGLELDDVVELINLGVLGDVVTVYSYNTGKISRKAVEDFLNFYRSQRSQPPQQSP